MEKSIFNPEGLTFVEQYLKRQKTTPVVETRFHWGPSWKHCLQCEAEINDDNPGKRVEYIMPDGTRHVDTVCLSCYIEPDYIELVFKNEIVQVSNFNPEQ
jgi:hypothetical protein